MKRFFVFAALLSLAAFLVLAVVLVGNNDSEFDWFYEKIESNTRQLAGTGEDSQNASEQKRWSLDEWVEIASKRHRTMEEYQAAYDQLVVPIGNVSHYVGPQTAEALMLLVHTSPESPRTYDEYKAHYQRMLDRGLFFQDTWDIGHYGHILLEKLYGARDDHANYPGEIFELYGVPEGSWEELDEAIIDHDMRTWPATKANFNHAFKTDEGTINVALYPGTHAIAMSVVGDPVEPGKSRFTDEEKYNISRHGIAPEGYRLRFVNNLWDEEELPPDKIPFFSEKKYVEDLSNDRLNELLVAIPSYLSQPEAIEQSAVMWMSMVDRYEAALEELASRGHVPEPFANQKPPPLSSPSGAVRSSAAPPGIAPAPRPPVEQRESAAPPVEARDEAAVAEAEKRKRIAEAFLEVLEKAAEKGNVDPASRSLIAARLRELRIMQNPDLLKPPSPSQQPAQDNSGGSKEE